MEKIRTFIAVELPGDIRGELSALRRELDSPGLAAKWVSPHNIHLTLKFLGSVERSKIAEMETLLEESLREEKEFKFELSGLGAFPSASRPRVLWVGISEGKEELRRIARKIEHVLEKMGFPKEERGFSAHVTLARVKSEGRKGELGEKLERAHYTSHPIVVSRIAIMKSDLTPEGPVYTRLGEIRLS
ncbi:hypothetical protein AMJ40_00535 [candidate division TA06 bacterium DG_26]|uniref:RNA 2',3'-cyclic phosphodiesterase n=1 Tax=candidate division TA06 bacterium DG_26 TaxID=1703771 RepID=A0A0S7WM62_UNCT6|nr:MAG: hypothetical protein AMJ40_00535 [candidate division TA06 bacterium DG_26]